MNETGKVRADSKLIRFYQFMRDAYVLDRDNWFLNIVNKIKKFLGGIRTHWITLDWGEPGAIATPLSVTEEIKNMLISEWPAGVKVRLLLDRLDDSWDASKESSYLIIGLLKAANDINAVFSDKIITTIFLRSDIYDNLFFDDQDKLRQNEEIIRWDSEELKEIVTQRVKVSLSLVEQKSTAIWDKLFSKKAYRSRASAEKYIIDRTFKRPRDIISFTRFAIEAAVKNDHNIIEPADTKLAEEEKYSQSKYKDLIIEYQKQYPFIKDLLDSLSGSLHKMTQQELLKRITGFIGKHQLQIEPIPVLRLLFICGVIGVKRQGRAGLKQRGGAHFYYFYEDPSINPLAYHDYYIHPSLRYYLNISEKRERVRH